MSVLVSVQSPELVSRVGIFLDLCPFPSSQHPNLSRSTRRSFVSRASSRSLRCSTSSVNQQISSELRPHLSPFSLPPSSVSRFSLLASSYPRLLFLVLCLPPSHCWVRSAGRKSSYVFTFCRDTCTPTSLRARAQNITADLTRTLNLTSNAAP